MSPSTNFLPEFHGFRFINRFEKIWPNPMIRLIMGKSAYGICGGMVFSALDHFNESAELPDMPSELAPQQKFIKYLWKRQMKSMPLGNYISVFYRAFQKDTRLLIDTISRQLPRVLDCIDKNQAAPLVIIRSEKFENLTNNHQVLVIGYEREGSMTELFCYDPNHPLVTTKLTINRDINALSITQSSGEEIRGFFCNRYVLQGPYQTH